MSNIKDKRLSTFRLKEDSFHHIENSNPNLVSNTLTAQINELVHFAISIKLGESSAEYNNIILGSLSKMIADSIRRENESQTIEFKTEINKVLAYEKALEVYSVSITKITNTKWYKEFNDIISDDDKTITNQLKLDLKIINIKK